MLWQQSKCCHLTTGTIKSIFHLILALAPLTIGHTCMAQSLSNEVIGIDGGPHIASQVFLNRMVSELAFETVSSGRHQFTKGFHQPYALVNQDLILPETPLKQ